MARLALVRAVIADDVRPQIESLGGVDVVTQSEFEAAGGHAAIDLAIYHMGNHFKFHHWIHAELLRAPGLAVLHDASLLDFYRAFTDGDGPAFAAELRLNHGSMPGGTDSFRTGTNGQLDRMRLPMLRRIAESSRGIIVHSDWARDDLSHRFPHRPVFHVPLGVPVLPEGPEGARLRAWLGWSPDDVVFGLLGGIWAHKRLDLPIRVFAAIRGLAPRARLLIAGRNESPETFEQITLLVKELELGSDAAILTELAGDDFNAAVLASDVLVDLRPPTAGEVPATLMRAFGAGRPALTTDLPQLRDFDPRYCWRVSPDPVNAVKLATETMLLLATEPSRVRAAGRLAQAHTAASAGLQGTAERYVDIAHEIVDRSTQAAIRPIPAPRVGDVERGPGVNVIGDFEATTGLMEAARQTVTAIIDAGADVQVSPLSTGSPQGPSRRLAELDGLVHGRSYPLDLWFVNIDDFRGLTDEVLRPPNAPRRAVAWWHWEMPTLPAFASDQLSRVDEIWVSSRFVARACRWAGSTPVTVMPCVVDVPLPPESDRSDHSLPEDACLFFYNFDANSSDARKNPWGLVEAFSRAFTAEERRGPARLVVKVQHLARHPVRAALLDALASVDAILIEDELPRHAMNGLMGSVDVYVSLHRAEGFGMGMAEAMFLGKPVIATAYSGNMDFTSVQNSCLVGCTLRPVTDVDHRHHPHAGTVYQPGLLWAEPDLDQAARWMRHLYDYPEERRRIGSAGAETVRSRYRRDVVGRSIVDRLAAIHVAAARRPPETPTPEAQALIAQAADGQTDTPTTTWGTAKASIPGSDTSSNWSTWSTWE